MKGMKDMKFFMPFVERRSAERSVLVAAALVGFALGAANAEWQWSVEHSQILSGLVRYSPDVPQAVTASLLSNLITQFGALLLTAGVSELALCVVLSGLMGMLSLLAITTLCLAFGCSVSAALTGTLVVALSRVTDYWAAYPLLLFGTPHTYGAIGFSFAALAVGLVAMGRVRAGAVLLGLSPAVHAANGAWCLVLMTAVVLLGGREIRRLLARGLPWFALGLAITLASVVLKASPRESTDWDAAAALLRALLASWDGHRGPIALSGAAVTINLAVAGLAAVQWWVARRELSHLAKAALAFAVLTCVASVLVAGFVTLLPAAVPPWLSVVIPGRFLNFGVLMAVPCLLGAAARWRPTIWATGFVGLVLLGLLFAQPGISAGSWKLSLGVERLTVLVWLLRIGALGVLMNYMARGRRPGGLFARFRFGAAGHPGFLHAVVVGVGLFALLVLGVRTSRDVPIRVESGAFADWRSDSVFAALSRSSGPLLVASDLFLIQARTRRPVLLDAYTIDTLSYAPAAAPATQRILRGAYGIDLFAPPPETERSGRLPAAANRRIWESFSAVRWAAVRREFGVTRVLTPPGWRLTLPITAESATVRVYSIPD